MDADARKSIAIPAQIAEGCRQRLCRYEVKR